MVNTSGIEPLDLRVLVQPDVIEEKVGSIFLPEQIKERDKYAQIRATIIAIGENAWEEASSRSSGFSAPKVGDRVIIQKYGGIDLEGPKDGKMYRLLNDQDILGRLA